MYLFINFFFNFMKRSPKNILYFNFKMFFTARIMLAWSTRVLHRLVIHSDVKIISSTVNQTTTTRKIKGHIVILEEAQIIMTKSIRMITNRIYLMVSLNEYFRNKAVELKIILIIKWMRKVYFFDF